MSWLQCVRLMLYVPTCCRSQAGLDTVDGDDQSANESFSHVSRILLCHLAGYQRWDFVKLCLLSSKRTLLLRSQYN